VRDSRSAQEWQYAYRADVEQRNENGDAHLDNAAFLSSRWRGKKGEGRYNLLSVGLGSGVTQQPKFGRKTV